MVTADVGVFGQGSVTKVMMHVTHIWLLKIRKISIKNLAKNVGNIIFITYKAPA